MRAARFWLRWSWRDLRKRWLLVTAIALLIAIGSGTYAGFGSVSIWRKDSNDKSFALLNAHDLRVTLSEGSYAHRGELRRALRSMRSPEWVDEAQERLVVPTQVDASAGGRRVLAPGRVVGMDVSVGEPRVDDVFVERGRGLREGDDGRSVAVLESGFAEENALPPSGRIRLPSGEPLRYVGQGRSPDYFLVVDETGGFIGGESAFAVVFAPLRTAQLVARRPAAVNELVLTLAPGVDPRTAEEELSRAFAAELPRLGITVTRGPNETVHRILYRDAEGDQKFLNVFAFLMLAGAALAAFNLISRVVETQRREIGVGMALGVDSPLLALRPLLLGAQIALLGVVLGLPVGILVNAGIRSVFEAQLSLPVLETPLDPWKFAQGALLGFLIPFAATAFPVLRAVRMQPIDAIRVGFRTVKGGGLAPLLKRVRVPGRSLGQMPVRNVVRAPRRTLMTVLGIAAVITSVVAVLGMIDSFLATTDRSRDEILGGAPDRLEVSLDDHYPARSREISAITDAPRVGAAEARLRFPVELSSDGSTIDASVELLDPGSPLWTPTVSEGQAPRGNEVLLAEETARDLGVEPGEEITARLPVRTGPDAFDIVNAPVSVAGLHPNPFRTLVYANRTAAEAIGLGGLANEVAVTPAPGASTEKVQRALFDRPGVASVRPVSAATDALQEGLDEFVGVLRITELAGLLLALLIAFNTTSINADERAREYATMAAYGVPVLTVVRISVLESVLVGVMGTAIGLVLGLAVISWVINEITPQTLPEIGVVVSLSPASIAAAVAVGIGAMALAPLLTIRRLLRMDIPATLRVVE
jgi:putative ABC transport system permease protein